MYQNIKHFKVHETTSDRLENRKNNEILLLSFILNYLIYIIKLWMGSKLSMPEIFVKIHGMNSENN